MPSGRTSRRTRQAPPGGAGAEGGRNRRASPKVLLAAAVVAVLAGVALVLAIVLSGGSTSTSSSVPAVGRVAGGLPGAADVQRLFQGIPQRAAVLGEAKAPVTLVEYVDLQCPYCREYESVVLHPLLTHYVRTGKLRIEMRLLAFLGPDSVRGRSAALAAGEQNRQFNFSELLFFNQGTENTGWLTQQMVEAAAASIPGLRVHQLLASQTSPAVQGQEKQIDSEAKAAGVAGTPTIMVGKTGSAPHQVTLTSPTDLHSIVTAINSALG